MIIVKEKGLELLVDWLFFLFENVDILVKVVIFINEEKEVVIVEIVL